MTETGVADDAVDVGARTTAAGAATRAKGPIRYTSVQACVEETLQRVGPRVVLGTPLGLGKANHLVNEFLRRAVADPTIDLHIFTALTLSRPRAKNELQRRFLEPLVERLFAGYPELDYVEPLRRGTLPANVRVTEFYFQPKSQLESPLAQRTYVSSNYTHVVRDLQDAGVNVLAQLVAKDESGGLPQYSLSCNPDLTLDLVPLLRESERAGNPVALLAQINRNLPFMYGDAVVAPDFFDAVVDEPRYDFPLFGAPSRPVSTADYLLALHVSALIQDGGTLQVGIGSLGHAITYLLKLRHENNAVYRELLDRAGVLDRFGPLIDRWGGTGPFEKGLYAASEMLIDGFLELRRCGVLRRQVYDHPAVQRLLNEGRIAETVTPKTLTTLTEAGVVPPRWSFSDFTLLEELGVLRAGLRYVDGAIVMEDGSRVPADLHDPDAATTIARACLGDRLRGGHFCHACFFLGPQRFYEELRTMPRSERDQICMTRISFVNALYGQEELKRLQRRAARFVNTGLVVTLGGAVASDALDDGRVLSGVGGQYNFVAMAHELDDGRSILMIRATAKENGDVTSNVRWKYAHATIPRHLRDVVVTEYGIADLRGRTDEEVAARLIEVADARFQGGLVEEAKRSGKLADDYRLPESARRNTPERLDETLAPFRQRGLFPEFPFGTDLTREELVLRRALTHLKDVLKGEDLTWPGPEEIRKTLAIPDRALPYLERMGLAHPEGPKELLMQRAVAYALAATGAV